ncbi:hypothetical protein WIS52_20505 [Pseudonocardia nematodicida]|uniref:Uncharacterized protein n=1 Tax=Pseudonocardia nematodicida TaxID=1206997 RepID=A0ABV1KEI2_9PSEU
MGASRILVDLRTASRPAGGSQVIDLITGREIDSPLNGQPGWSRRSDQRELTICSLAPFAGTDAVLGFDQAGDELWRITHDSGRVPPTITATWHGKVYGYTDAGPLILDGRTGDDRAASTVTAPLLVNEYFAIAAAPATTPEQSPTYSQPHGLAAHPTTD